jgi:beta-mannosidase
MKTLLSLLFGLLLAAPGLAQNLWQPYYLWPRSGDQHLSLAGEWQLGHLDKPAENLAELANLKDVFAAQVPNSVHFSLHKAGKLPHPYYHKNSDLYKWVEEKTWYYRKKFSLNPSQKGNYVFLCFDGVDYFSKVWLNGQLLGAHEGMFGGPTVEVGSLANFGGENEMVVEVRAGNWGNRGTEVASLPRLPNGERDLSQRKGFNPRASGKIIKPWIISGGSGCEEFFTVGIWKDIRVEVVPRWHLERPYLTTKSASPEKAELHLSCEVFTKSHSLTQVLHAWKNQQINHPNEKGSSYPPFDEKLTFLIEFSEKKRGETVFAKEVPLNLYEGRNWAEQDLVLPNPKLWNPTGLGEPHLYQVTLSLKNRGQVIDRLVFDYGIRTVERLPTAGPRTVDRWENWQFVVNGQKIFVKGMNLTPHDLLLDLTPERYRWTLAAAKKMGVQLVRVWGGGLLETEHFYQTCNELGIMVWQDFPIGNQDTPDYPQDVWEAQVVQNIARLRNHPSLVMWCGGNEFNPYSYGNAATMGILERNLDIFDPSRFYVRTTPDDGSAHVYPDMDPTWYSRSYRYEAWMSETGIHSIPEAASLAELVDNQEFTELGKMWDKSFASTHPQFVHHFAEYGPNRVPRMLSRASHLADMANPTLEAISEASQVGAGEFYQVFSEKLQGNYPTTAGLMPWVLKRHWPVIAIQLMDWFGHASAPYYFLKRTYEPTHVALDLPRLLWAKGEAVPLTVQVTHAQAALAQASVAVHFYNDKFELLAQKSGPISLAAGPSVTRTSLESVSIPADYADRFFFLLVELKDANGQVVSTSWYFPRSLALMDQPEFRDKYLREPVAWPTLAQGPWLRPTVAKTPTNCAVEVVAQAAQGPDRSQFTVRVRNLGKVPAFMGKVDVAGAKRALVASDNYFWLAPGQTKEVELDVLWREPANRAKAEVVFSAWNAKLVKAKK